MPAGSTTLNLQVCSCFLPAEWLPVYVRRCIRRSTAIHFRQDLLLQRDSPPWDESRLYQDLSPPWSCSEWEPSRQSTHCPTDSCVHRFPARQAATPIRGGAASLPTPH